MPDKYYDSEGWKKCSLRSLVEDEEGLWLICGTCQKSRDFNAAEWAAKHRVDLDIPLKTLEKAIRCQRCGARGKDRAVSAYGTPYSIGSKPQPRRIDENDPICPRCGSDDVETRGMSVSEFPGVTIWTTDKLPRFVAGKMMIVAGAVAAITSGHSRKGSSSPAIDFA